MILVGNFLSKHTKISENGTYIQGIYAKIFELAPEFASIIFKIWKLNFDIDFLGKYPHFEDSPRIVGNRRETAEDLYLQFS